MIRIKAANSNQLLDRKTKKKKKANGMADPKTIKIATIKFYRWGGLRRSTTKHQSNI